MVATIVSLIPRRPGAHAGSVPPAAPAPASCSLPCASSPCPSSDDPAALPAEAVAEIRRRAIQSQHKLSMLIAGLDGPRDRRALVLDLWDTIRDVEQAIEGLSSESAGLDVLYD